MPISLYNSLTRRAEAFAPRDPNRVTMYVCGPTVYNYVHIGNARGPVVFDVLAKLLRRHYPGVVYARNITDVDDKINAAAQAQGVGIETITGKFAAAYREDMAKLGIAPPDIEPSATAHIGPMVAMIEKLIEGGHAYAAEGHALFDVASFPDYGKLSGRDTEEMLAGARVEVAPYKKNPADFVLWKPSTPELPGWDSPWGRGRPGWHIECSAMAARHLGDTIDIHAGGVDLLFPHHENEVAQSTCAHGGQTFARFWLHNGMLTFDGKKMSKSLGNVLQLHELLQQHPAEALRLRLMSGHYRQPLDWSDAAIAQAVSTLDGWYRVLRDLADIPVDTAAPPVPATIEAALCDDLNTPQALAELAKLASEAHKLREQIERLRISITPLNQIDPDIVQAHLQLLQSLGVPVPSITTPSNMFDAGNLGQELEQALIRPGGHVATMKGQLLAGGAALGLLQQDPEAWFKQAGGNSVDAAQVEALLEQRRAARAARDFARADAIRAELTAMGVAIEDGAQGTRWSVVK